ncbi:MAG: nucleotidyltransferase domain-containing protein [Propionivibrio sp.]|uniref:Nucleotidyltransferase domain-containing protein n=1 Tax=Candidatus Propionivibrio dominans TaxID=2954373 RepID=A0A9D7F9A3_9RHOO|nr:nucleotidyltransferase domain-containing protein [Candidatus Propionivibrio dominans]
MHTKAQSPHPIDAQLREVFVHFPKVVLVVLFGSVASGKQRADSDLDIALSTGHPLTVDEKIALIGALAESTGRAIDLIDLSVVGEPLLGQIVRHGRRVLGSDTLYGELIGKHLFEQADFMPYQARILAERRMAWIGK